MNLTQLSETVYVSGQIHPTHLSELKAQGFGTVICNRPDGEDPGQPTAEEIRQSATEVGIKFFHVPFNPMNPNPEMVSDFGHAIQQAEGLILAYCRSGNRSSRLWAAVSQG